MNIYKKFSDSINFIELKELTLNYTKTILKGYFNLKSILNENNENLNQNENHIEFILPSGRRFTTISI